MRHLPLVISLFAALALAVPAHPQSAVNRIVITKSARTMVLYNGQSIIKKYKVSLGWEPVGAKTRQGDHRTPEGPYKISGRNPHSAYHKSLRISYPNRQDRERARKLGVSPGGDIMIHGLPNGKGYLGKGHLLYDWTDGCIAVTDEEIDEIWRLVPDGTTVVIEP